MTSKPDAELSRFLALLNQLTGAGMLSGAHPKNTAAVDEVARVKAELQEMYEEAGKPKLLPIETAPHDGTAVLVWDDATGRIYDAKWVDLDDGQSFVWMKRWAEIGSYGAGAVEKATGWMPMPASLEEARKGK